MVATVIKQQVETEGRGVIQSHFRGWKDWLKLKFHAKKIYFM